MSTIISITGINVAQNMVSEERLEANVDSLLRELMQLGSQTATDSFSAQQSYYPDEGGIPKITYSRSGEGGDITYTLTASGNGVLFQEYGTGVGASHPEGEALGYTMDSWSINHKRMFHDKGWWIHKKKWYQGQPACMGMYNARKEMTNNIESKAKEVWK